MPADPDAVVIGGGPAGATAALLLARAGWSVVVLEKKSFPRRKVCGEYLSATNLPLLRELGVSSAFEEMAGPAVCRVGLFAGRTILEAELPRPNGDGWGRALGREHLDSLMLDAARRAGAIIQQPCSVTGLTKEGELFRVAVKAGAEWRTPVVIAAHGSWDAGTLPTQPPRCPPRPGDLLGFKAHFQNAALPDGLMPLLAFPGGYGGLVHCDAGRVSLSCCVRRDRLAQLGGRSPGEAVFTHVMDSCVGARRVLERAKLQGPWLAAGPIRPGIRVRGGGGLFRVGNAAGEAHPVVAEGISMAMQSAWLLAQFLLKAQGRPALGFGCIQTEYAAAWRRCFAPRLHASAVIANWAMRPDAVAALVPLLRCFPSLLTWGARFSGKARRLIRS